VADLTTLLHAQSAQMSALQTENKLLKQKNQLLLQRLFGRKSEKLDPLQMELLLGELARMEASAASPRLTTTRRRAHAARGVPANRGCRKTCPPKKWCSIR